MKSALVRVDFFPTRFLAMFPPLKLLFLIQSCQFEPCCLQFILLTTFDRPLCACVHHMWAYYWMDYPSK